MADCRQTCCCARYAAHVPIPPSLLPYSCCAAAPAQARLCTGAAGCCRQMREPTAIQNSSCSHSSSSSSSSSRGGSLHRRRQHHHSRCSSSASGSSGSCPTLLHRHHHSCRHQPHSCHRSAPCHHLHSLCGPCSWETLQVQRARCLSRSLQLSVQGNSHQLCNWRTGTGAAGVARPSSLPIRPG